MTATHVPYDTNNKSIDTLRSEIHTRPYLKPLEITVKTFDWDKKTREMHYLVDRSMFDKISENGWYEGLLIKGNKHEVLFVYSVKSDVLPDGTDVWIFEPYSGSDRSFRGSDVPAQLKDIKLIVGIKNDR